MFDGEAFGAEIVEAVRGYVAREMGPVLARLAELEARAPEPGPKGDKGLDGQDGRDGVDGLPGGVGAPGLDGKDGRDGTDGAAGLQGVPGEPGRDGKDGLDGIDGAPGKDAEPLTREQLIEAVLAMPDALDEAVRRHLEASPPPAGRDGRDGVDGKDGADGLNGADGQSGHDGKDGADGVGVAGAFKDHEGALILTLTNGDTRNLGLIDGKDGRDGMDGRDGKDGERGAPGFSLSSFDTELHADGRTVLLKFSAGDVEEVHELCFPVSIDRGVYKAEAAYARGDAVTWGGSSWIAQRDVAVGEKPEASDAWRLAVKRGRDGKDGKDGERGEKGAAGKDGRGF